MMLTIISGCTSSSVFNKRVSKERASEKQDIDAFDGRNESKDVLYTFLDTLNRGNELVLNEEDFGKENITIDAVFSGGTLVEMPYRVQVFASNSIEAVRERKKELETTTDEPVLIGYEAPYYKLYVGKFSKKDDARLLLSGLKKKGYVDAWIVSVQ